MTKETDADLRYVRIAAILGTAEEAGTGLKASNWCKAAGLSINLLGNFIRAEGARDLDQASQKKLMDAIGYPLSVMTLEMDDDAFAKQLVENPPRLNVKRTLDALVASGEIRPLVSVDHILPKGAPIPRADNLIMFGGEEYAALPVFDVRAAAGAGALVEQENVSEHQLFRHQWLRSITPAPLGQLALVTVDGDSMQATLHNGDQVLVDLSQNRFRRDGIYLIEMGDGLQVKRVAVHPTTRLVTVKSDNPLYPTWPDLNPDEIRWVGRVVWLGRRV